MNNENASIFRKCPENKRSYVKDDCDIWYSVDFIKSFYVTFDGSKYSIGFMIDSEERNIDVCFENEEDAQKYLNYTFMAKICL